MPFLSLNDLTRTEGTATSVHRVRSRGSSLQRRRPTQISHLALTGQPARGALENKNVARTDVLEKAMAPHSSTLAWQIPWTEEPGRLQSTGPLRVRHD